METQPLDLREAQGPTPLPKAKPDQSRRHPHRPIQRPRSLPRANLHAHRRLRQEDPGRPRARRRGHAHLRRPPAPQRRRHAPRTDDEPGLDHPPGHQRRGFDPRLGICLVRRSTESVEKNVATGTFGSWDETSTNIHLALMAGALDGLGYGRSLGKFILEDGATLPPVETLENAIRDEPRHPLTAARADLLQAMIERELDRGTNDYPSQVETCLDFRTGVSSRHPADGPSGHRLRHHHQSPDLQRRGDRTRRGPGLRAVRGLGAGPGRRRGAVDRLGHHGAAGVREGHELREQPAIARRQGHPQGFHDLRRRPPGWRRLGLVAGRAPEDQPGLLPAILQELFANGRRHALLAV